MGSPNKSNFKYIKGDILEYVENLDKITEESHVVKEESYKNKTDFRNNINRYDENIQNRIKKYLHKTSSSYTDFKIKQYENGLYKLSSKKPGNVPKSYAIYTEIFYKDGIIRTKYKDTYDNKGNFVHRHIKWPISEKTKKDV